MTNSSLGPEGKARQGEPSSSDRTATSGSEVLRIAYADPPYPGCAHLYEDHPDYNGEVDHEALITELVGYDGWALSTSSKALQSILFFCPEHVRVLVWVKNTVRYAWEPVIISPPPSRAWDDNVRDWIHVEPEMYQWRPRPAEYVIGQKPEPFCRWLFSWLGAEPQDEFVDMFPGSGAVGRAWERFAAELSIGPNAPPNTRSSKRAARKALREHPTLDWKGVYPGHCINPETCRGLTHCPRKLSCVE